MRPTPPGSLFSAEQLRALSALHGWVAQDAEGRVATLVEDPSILSYVAVMLDALDGLAESEMEWQRRGDRSARADAALRRILGLLSNRRWWNHNVWAAEEVAKAVLLDVR